MKNLSKLIAGEMKRLIRYKILPVSLVTAVLWIILFLFLSESEAREIAPLLILIDVAAMSILLLGASHHLEKQEDTIRSMLVMPVSYGQILAAKAVSSLVLAVESAVVTSAALFFIHGVTFNYAVLLLFVAIAGAAPCGNRVCPIFKKQRLYFHARFAARIYVRVYLAFFSV